MPATTETSVVYDVHDFKVAPLLTDTVTAGNPTYGALIDVPGIADISIDPNLVTAELKGDAKVIAKKGRVDKFNFSATYGKLSLPVLNAILGMNAEVIVTPTGRSRSRMRGNNSLPYFLALVLIDDADVGSIHVISYKCQVTGGTILSQSSDNFGQPTINFEGIPTEANDNLFFDIDFYDENTALAVPTFT